MKLPDRMTAAVVLSAGILAGTGGCEDSSARQRDAAQAQIRQASLKLQKTLAGGAADDSSAQSLNGIVADLGRIEAGEPGQQAAKAILTATALREMAGINLDAAEQIELSNRMQRLVIGGQVEAAATLEANVAALESFNAGAEREQLQRDLDSAREEVADLRKKIDQLDGPISERAMANTSNKKEVDALRIKVNDLRRRAQELGHADGLNTYLEAVKTSRQADKIEYNVAQREIELDYSLTPELTMADTEAQQLDAMIQTIEAAQAQLDAFAAVISEAVTNTRTQIADLTTRVKGSLGQMSGQTAEDLNGAYDEAIGRLEKAASQIQGAVRQVKGDDAQAVKLIAVQIQETLGRLRWGQARGLADHAALLARLESLAGGASGSSSSELKSILAAHDSSIEQAKAAYGSALDLLTQVQSRTDPNQIALYTRSLEAVIASLNGPSAAPSPGTADRDTGASASAAPAEAPGSFATAQELHDYLASLPKNGEGMRASLALLHASTPDGMKIVKATTEMTDAFSSLDGAMQEKFGQSLFDTMGPMLANTTPDLSKATVSEETDDRVVYTTTVMGQTNRTVLRNIDGSWKVDADDMDAQTKAMLPLLEQMTASMSKAAAGLVNRIRNGEFKTAQEVMAAFGQAMMGGMGGAPAGPRPSMPGSAAPGSN